MIAVEKTCLEHFKSIISEIPFSKPDSKLLSVLEHPIFIANWTTNNKLLLYFAITKKIFSAGNLEAIYNYLFTADQNSFKNEYYKEAVYDSVVSRYFSFYQRIYDIYLLNRIYFILNKFSPSEIKQLDFGEITCNNQQSFKTFNVTNFLNLVLYESNELTQVQHLNDESLWFKIDRRLYYLKAYYLSTISRLLANPNFQNKFKLLKQRLKAGDLSNPQFCEKMLAFIFQNFNSRKKKLPESNLVFQYRLLQ